MTSLLPLRPIIPMPTQPISTSQAPAMLAPLVASGPVRVAASPLPMDGGPVRVAASPLPQAQPPGNDQPVRSSPIPEPIPVPEQVTPRIKREVAEAIEPRAGPTAERPVGVPVGFCYFDTTLGKPIWFISPGWVDATGTAA